MPNEMHACEVHAHEMHAYEMHTHKVQGHETHARKMHAHETRAYEVNPYEMYWEGIGRGGQQQRRPALGEKGDFAVHPSVYGKVWVEPNVSRNDQERRKGGERCLLVARAGLSSYLCRLCTLCVHLSVLGGGIHPTTVHP
jgi:hypothetical protein